VIVASHDEYLIQTVDRHHVLTTPRQTEAAAAA
jgi:hypothetical protein